MNDRELRKSYRRQFAPVSWWLLGYHVLMILAVNGAVIIQRLISTPTQAEMEGNAWGYIASCIIGMLLLVLWKGVPFWKDKVWARGRAMEMGDFLCLLVLTIGCQLAAVIGMNVLELLLNIIGFSGMKSIESATTQPDTFSWFLYVGVFAPIFEELIFRGFVMQSLKPFGKKFAILGAAILFGLFHGNLFQSPYAILVGMVLGYTAMEHSIGWAMLLHMINNLVLSDMFQRLDALIGNGIMLMLSGLLNIGTGIAAVILLCVRIREIRSYEFWNRIDGKCMRALLFNAGSIVLMVLLALNMILLITPL